MNTRFFTGRGDNGNVSVGKTTLGKEHPLFAVLGSVDELISWLGMCRVEATRFQQQIVVNDLRDIASIIKEIQEVLFILQSELASIGFALPFRHHITKRHTEFLEHIIAEIDTQYPELRQFVIPGGTELAARLDVARATARYCERLMKSLDTVLPVSQELLQFLNRLSSALFALARYSNHMAGVVEDNPRY